MNNSNRWVLYGMLLTVSIIWGSSFAFMKHAVREVSPFVVVLFRAGGASLLFAITLLFLGSQAKLYRRDVPLFFLLGMISVSLFMPLQVVGVSFTYAVHASLIIALSPLAATLIAWFLGWQKMRMGICIGLALAFSGVAVVATQALGSSGSGSNVLLGDSLMFLSAIFWAAFTLLGSKIMQRYRPLVAVAYIHFFGFAQLLVVFLFYPEMGGQVYRELSGASASTWAILLGLAILSSYYAFIVWYRGVETIGPVRTAVFQYFNPLFGSIAAIIILNEPVSIFLALGGFLIVGGVFLANKYR